MAITGIAELTNGVEKLDPCIRYLEAFSLANRESSGKHTIFELVSGQCVNLYRSGDERIPDSQLVGRGVHECVWAVGNQADLDGLVADLSRDYELSEDGTGTVHSVTAFGQAIGLMVFQPRQYMCWSRAERGA